MKSIYVRNKENVDLPYCTIYKLIHDILRPHSCDSLKMSLVSKSMLQKMDVHFLTVINIIISLLQLEMEQLEMRLKYVLISEIFKEDIHFISN